MVLLCVIMQYDENKKHQNIINSYFTSTKLTAAFKLLTGDEKNEKTSRRISTVQKPKQKLLTYRKWYGTSR